MKKERKPLSAGKKLTVLFLVIVLIFTAVNLFWLITVNIPYRKYCMDFDRADNGNYVKTAGEYTYIVKMPSYLDFSSFLSVTEKDGYWVNFDEDENVVSTSGMCVSLYIWPSWKGGYKYGADFLDDLQDILLLAPIDSDCNYLPNPNDYEENIVKKQELVDEYSEQLHDMMDGAKEIWEIG